MTRQPTYPELVTQHDLAVSMTYAAAHAWLSHPTDPTAQMNYEACREMSARLAQQCANKLHIES